MKALLIAGLLVSSVALGQSDLPPYSGCYWNDCEGPQAGPAPCVPGWVCPLPPPPPTGVEVVPVGPNQLCLGTSGCFPVSYRVDGGFVLAESVLPNGYRVLGWSGPCAGMISSCPDIGKQAHADLRMNALRIYRGLRFEGQVP